MRSAAGCSCRFLKHILTLRLFCSGHTLFLSAPWLEGLDIDPPCKRKLDDFNHLTLTGTHLHGTGPTQTFTDGVTQVHNAWHISWEASDTSTLSPVPPSVTLSSSETVTTYTSTSAPDSGNDSGYLSQLIIWKVILPIVIIFLIIGIGVGLYLCMRLDRQRRRQRLVQQTANVAL